MSRRRGRRFARYIPAVLMLVLIFGFSSQNGEQSGGLSDKVYQILSAVVSLPVARDTAIFLIRKAAHMTEFGLLALSLRYGIAGGHGQSIAMKLALPLTFFFACCDEFHQTFVGGRYGCFRDVLIDTAGGAIFLILYWLTAGRKHRN